MASVPDITLMNENRIGRTLHRMAYEIAESNREDKKILLAGVSKRGHVTALLLADALRKVYDTQKVEVVSDPLESLKKKKLLNTTFNSSSYLLIVDDVIFSGRTMFEALIDLATDNIPGEIHTLVLVDRGHRKFPIQADFVGLNCPTKLKEHVTVVTGKGSLKRVVLKRS